jgi:hypothetical protein
MKSKEKKISELESSNTLLVSALSYHKEQGMNNTSLARNASVVSYAREQYQIIKKELPSATANLLDSVFESVKSQIIALKRTEVKKIEDYLDSEHFWKGMPALHYVQMSAYYADLMMQGVQKDRKDTVFRTLKKFAEAFRSMGVAVLTKAFLLKNS